MVQYYLDPGPCGSCLPEELSGVVCNHCVWLSLKFSLLTLSRSIRGAIFGDTTLMFHTAFVSCTHSIKIVGNKRHDFVGITSPYIV